MSTQQGHARDGGARVAVVAGDVTIDWNLARTRRDGGGGAVWNSDDATRASWQPGGAALAGSLIAEVARTLEACGQPAWQVHHAYGRIEAPRPSDPAYHHSYAIWSNRARAKAPPLWRVEEFVGLDPAASPPPRADAGDPADAALVVLDDAALGFRSRRDAWPQAIAAGARPWIVVKMSSPVADGDLAEHLCRDHGGRLIVIMTVTDLRRTEVQVSRELSWERTAQDLAWELVHNPRVNALSRCAATIVSFDTAGAFLMTGARDGAAPEGKRPAARLFFDPHTIEGAWRHEHPGGVIGYTTCLAAAVAREIMASPAEPDLAAGVQRGLSAMRALHLGGYESDGAAAGTANLRFPLEAIAGELAAPAFTCAVVEVRDPVGATHPAKPGAGGGSGAPSPMPPLWTILEDRLAADPGHAAERIVEHGAEAALTGVPLGRFGRLLTVDRREIEGLRAIRNVTLEYWRRGSARPLSIAVFGAPGSGKSFGVTEMASALLPDRIRPLAFNLSQFTGPADLRAAFHQVRDAGLSGKLPLVFWDEFDTSLGGQRLGWLRHFLAPMQDGTFQEGEVVHPIGRSIFVFAGGTKASLEEFTSLAHGETEEEFKSAKGPDFVSRLKGFLNVPGPNPQRTGANHAGGDAAVAIRRAILLRSILEREAPQLLRPAGGGTSLAIDRGVLRAFLHTRIYKHGVRSLESIVAMSTLIGKSSYERSSLPPADQLDVHVDALDFQALVRQPELTGELLERLARAAHDVWCEGKRRGGFTYGHARDESARTTPLLVEYEWLPDQYKDANRSNVRTIPRKLAAAGYVMIPSRGNEPPFSFPGVDLERLAELEHELWMEARLAEGWRLGVATPEDPRRSPHLVPWNEVPDAIKQSDRDLIVGIPRILSAAGYAIVRVAGHGDGDGR